MKAVLNWAKSNPISVASIVIALVSLVAFWLMPIQGGAAVQKKASKWNSKLSDVQRYQRGQVEIPGEVNGESETISPITINEKVINKIKGIYSKVNDGYNSLFEETLQRNQASHKLLVPEVFDPKMKDNLDLPYKFRNEYKEAFVKLMQPVDPSTGMPQLNAGLAPSPEELAMAVKEARDSYIASIEVTQGAPVGENTLTIEEQKKIETSQLERVIEVIQNQALNVNVYAEPNMNQPLFPFQLGAWALDSRAPKPEELYEGQIELWLQQDVASAIALANDIYEVDDNGSFAKDEQGQLIPNERSSVLTGPFKNLKHVEIISGYVGIQTLGGVGKSSQSRTSNTLHRSVINYTPPAEMIGDDQNQKVGANFHLSPTGRGSNPVYDVRHVKIIADVDYQRLPKIFEAFSKINFMTIVDCQIKQIDEYELLSQGYMYGSSDCVEVEMVVESIWLRDLTRDFMPELTQEYLGLKESATSNMDEMMNGYY